MDWLIWVSLGALFISILHEVNRFPATDKSIRKLQEKLEKLEDENQDLRIKVQELDSEIFSLSEEIEKIKDPSYEQKLY